MSKDIQLADTPCRMSDITPLSLGLIAPGLDQLFTPSYVVPFALVFHATSAGWIEIALSVSELICENKFN